jgi:5-methylcytosine-specific restriction protein A
MPMRVPQFRAAGARPGAAKPSARRLEDNRFYASARWLKLRLSKLRENPLCEGCERQGLVTAAVHVHHVKPRKPHPELAYEWANLEALCLPCHNAQQER